MLSVFGFRYLLHIYSPPITYTDYVLTMWCKCRKLLLNKYIYCFWVPNGTIKLKTVENGRVCAVTQRNNLVELFPDNNNLADRV